MEVKDTERSFEERWIEDESYALGREMGIKEVAEWILEELIDKCLLPRTEREATQSKAEASVGFFLRLVPNLSRKNMHKEEHDIYAEFQTKAQLEYATPIICGAVAEEICKHIEQLPTDGWDKWYFYNKKLANQLRVKFCGKPSGGREG